MSAPTRAAQSVASKSPGSFGVLDRLSADVERGAPDFVDIARSAEFLQLRGRLRRFVFPMSVLFLAWYLGYVLFAAYLPHFMGIQVFGKINIGLLMGIGQFVSTILITGLYVRFRKRQIDPRVAALRAAVAAGEDR